MLQSSKQKQNHISSEPQPQKANIARRTSYTQCMLYANISCYIGFLPQQLFYRARGLCAWHY